jgi:hypothetical protein
MWHDVYIINFMKIDTSVQTILSFCLRNLRGCNIGIIEGGFMNYAVEMRPNAVIYSTRFHKG